MYLFTLFWHIVTLGAVVNCLWINIIITIIIFFSNITDEKQPNVVAEEEQNQPEAEQQGSPEEQSMETNTGDDVGQDLEKKEKDKRKEAKVCQLYKQTVLF